MSDYTPETDNNEQKSIKQLRWQCRRGMLELDILLARFLNNRYESLATNEQQQFVELLTATDPELYAWLVTATAAPPTSLESIVNAVRKPLLTQN